MGPAVLSLLALLLLTLCSAPAWPYSRRWSHGPSGVFGVVWVVLLTQFLMEAF